MPTIALVTEIAAPPEACFALLRDPRIHEDDQVIHNAELRVGQRVTFESSFIGSKQRLTVEVVELNPPDHLMDVMTEGWFRSFVHVHALERVDGGTILRDVLTWTSPWGILGRIADTLVIGRRLRRTVRRRNSILKAIAEAPAEPAQRL